MTLVKAPTVTAALNGTSEATQRRINLVDNATFTWVLINDPANNELDIQGNVVDTNPIPDLSDGQLLGYSSGTGTLAAVGPAAEDGQIIVSNSARDVGYDYVTLSSLPTFYPANKCEFYDDMFMSTTEDGEIGLLGWSVAVATGTVTALASTNDTNSPGICVLNRSTTAAGRACINLGLAQVRLGGGEIIIEMRVRVSQLSNGTNTYTFRAGLGDSVSADHTDGVYFEHNSTSGNWILKTANNNTRSSTTSSIAVATGATWAKLRIEINSNATSVSYYVDGALAGTITTNIPTAAGRETGPNFQLVGTLGTVSVNAQIDYFYFKQTFTTPR